MIIATIATLSLACTSLTEPQDERTDSAEKPQQCDSSSNVTKQDANVSPSPATSTERGSLSTPDGCELFDLNNFMNSTQRCVMG